MRELHPSSGDNLDALACYLGDERPPPADRPWLVVNMIASLDGATAIDGKSGGLGGPGDKEVFRAVRATADWVLVASATAAAERYRSPTSDDDVAHRRRERGQAAAPRLAIVTASGRVDPSIPAIADPVPDAEPVLVITGTDGDTSGLAGTHAHIAVVDEAEPSPGAVLQVLREAGAGVVLAEGGPTWNGHLVASGVVDELCLSISPMLVGGSSPRIVAAEKDATPTDMRLDRLLEQDGMLFARYVRD